MIFDKEILHRLDTFAPAEATAAPPLRDRAAHSRPFQMGPDAHFSRLGRRGRPHTTSSRRTSAEFAASAGDAGEGPDPLLAALRLRDDIGQLEYKVWYFAALWLRPGSARQPDQCEAAAGADSVCQGRAVGGLVRPGAADAFRSRRCAPGSRRIRISAVYRFAIEDLYRQQEHVLDDKGERLLSLRKPFRIHAERCIRGALHRRRQVSNGRIERRGGDAHLRAVPRDPVDQPQPVAIAPRRSPRSTSCTKPTSTPTRRCTTACSSGDWFVAQARGYRTALDMALHGNNIPTLGRRKPDRDNQAGHRAACSVITGCASACSACRRITPTTT